MIMLENFFNKKSKIRFYSIYPGVADLFPIQKSSSVKRSFVKSKMPKGTRPVSACPGILKIANAGYVITAPADFKIITNGDGASFTWVEPVKFHKGMPGTESYIASHDAAQTDPILDDPSDTLRTTIKVETPWRVESSDDVVFLQLPVTYNNEDRFSSAIGILDPQYSHVINVQLFWKKLNEETLIRAGTPLCQYIPMKRKDLQMSNFDVTINEATDNDFKKEQAYNYAANSVLLETDTLASRLQRAAKVLTKYNSRG